MPFVVSYFSDQESNSGVRTRAGVVSITFGKAGSDSALRERDPRFLHLACAGCSPRPDLDGEGPVENKKNVKFSSYSIKSIESIHIILLRLVMSSFM